MSGLYLGILIAGGLLVALLVSGSIYFDTGRRGLSGAKRLLLATGFGLSCFGGFLAPYVYEEQLAYTYYHLVMSRSIVVSPREWVTVSVVTGLLISTMFVAAYFTGIRSTTPHTT